MKEQTIEMYRPVGPKEYKLLVRLDFKEWPPRLPEQPVFYPVTNEKYAIEVNKWNINDFGIGYITKFHVKKSFADKYEIHTAGAHYNTEWWIPSEDLDELNRNIVGKIEVIGEYTKANRGKENNIRLGVDVNIYSDLTLDTVRNLFDKPSETSDAVISVQSNVWGNTSLRLNRKYVLPKNHMFFGIREEDIVGFCENLYSLIPGYLKGTSLLPHAFARVERVHLSFVRRFQYKKSDYLYVFNLLTTNFGGEQKEEVITPYQADFGPSVLTDRVYFECYLLPLKKTEMKNARIVSYKPTTVNDLTGEFFTAYTSFPADFGNPPGGAIFADADFSPFHKKLTEKAYNQNWDIGDCFWPLMYKEESIALNLALAGIKNIQSVVPLFHDFISAIKKKKSLDFSWSDTAFQKYLSRYSVKPVYSRSSNREFLINHPLMEGN